MPDSLYHIAPLYDKMDGGTLVSRGAGELVGGVLTPSAVPSPQKVIAISEALQEVYVVSPPLRGTPPGWKLVPLDVFVSRFTAAKRRPPTAGELSCRY